MASVLSDACTSVAPPPGEKGRRAQVRLLSDDPVIGAGRYSDSWFVIVLPLGSVSDEIDLPRLRTRVNSEVSFEIVEAETGAVSLDLHADLVSFEQLTPAVEMLVDALSEAIFHGDGGSVQELVADLIDLFRVGDAGATPEQIMGLWGELFVLSESFDRETTARAWGARNDSNYDFASTDLAVEVKSTAGNRRIHWFSSSQLPPMGVRHVVILSVLLQEAFDGVTVLDLLSKIMEELSDPRLAGAVRRRALRAMNFDFSLASSMRFAANLRGLVKALDGQLIPSVDCSGDILSADWRVDVTSLECPPGQAAKLTALGMAMAPMLG